MQSDMNDLTKRLSAIIKNQLHGEYTSVSYAIMRHGELLAADALGYKNRIEMLPADMKCTYNVASVSKIFCTVAVMQLVEQGRLELDVPITRYLPKFRMPLDPRYTKITLRHCLNHSSGLPGTLWRGFSVSSTENMDYYADVYDYLAKSTLKADPGRYSVYCNDGFTMAEMVVAEVSGIPFAQYCMKYISEPVGAHSARLSPVHNPDYTLVCEGKKPPELLMIQGSAGFTTSMPDLCRFGNIFLHGSPILSRESMEEMAKPQGKTFLKHDTKSLFFGLGWDSVQFKDERYTLGEGVLNKNGESFQFDTQFYVIPKYDAVIAMSESHDCHLNTYEMIMRLFASAMLSEGENIYAEYKPVPKELVRKYAGTYRTCDFVFDLCIDGAMADAVRLDARKSEPCLWHDCTWNGEEFTSHSENRQFLFDTDGEDVFILTRFHGSVTGYAMKVNKFEDEKPLAPAWRVRIGKRYLPCDLDAFDEIPHDLVSAFRIDQLPGFEGLLVFTFSGIPNRDGDGFIENIVKPTDEGRGRSFSRTPSNGSRDLIDPQFFTVDGTEYCSVASYTYQDAASIADYAGQPYPEKARCNGVYRIANRLEAAPEVPTGHRALILDKDMIACYDSLMERDFKPVDEGYIILI